MSLYFHIYAFIINLNSSYTIYISSITYRDDIDTTYQKLLLLSFKVGCYILRKFLPLLLNGSCVHSQKESTPNTKSHRNSSKNREILNNVNQHQKGSLYFLLRRGSSIYKIYESKLSKNVTRIFFPKLNQVSEFNIWERKVSIWNFLWA